MPNSTRELAVVSYEKVDDERCLTHWVGLKSPDGGWVQSFGGIVFGQNHLDDWKAELCALFGVSSIEQIAGRQCFVLRCWPTWGEPIEGLDQGLKKMGFCGGDNDEDSASPDSQLSTPDSVERLSRMPIEILAAQFVALKREREELHEMVHKLRCFHVEAGKPCRRYEEGAKSERKAMVEFLKAVPEEVIHDWGLNAVGEIIEFVQSGVAGKGAWYWLTSHAALGEPEDG